jgi:O-antigen/teichoic acid export membrane protein
MRQLLRNFVALIVGFIGVRLISFASTLYMTNELGPTSFGIISSGLAIATIFSVVLNAVLDEYLIRQAAHHPQTIAISLGDGFMLKLALLPLASLTMLIVALINPDYWWLTLWMGLYSILHSFLMIYWAVLRGLELMKTQTSLTLIQVVIMAIGTIVATRITHSIAVIAPIYAGATLVALLTAYITLRRRHIHIKFQWRFAEMRQLWRTAIPFGFNYIVLLLFDRITIICITIFIGPFAVGLFSSVYNLTLIATSVPALLMTATLPLLVRAFRDKSGEVGLITANLLRYVMVLACGAAGGLYLLAPTIMTIFAAEYAPAATILRVLAWSLPPLFATSILINVLETIDQARLCASLLAKCLLVSLPLVIVGTRWGATLGASWSYVGAHVLLSSVLLHTLRRFVPLQQVAATIITPLAASGAMIMVATLIGTIHLVMALFAGCLAFVLILILGGIIGKADWLIVRSLFRRKHTSPI